jgi:hypothetical protein
MAKDIVSGKGNVILSQKDFELLIKYLDSIEFGSVTLTIRDSKVVGIEKNEKIRLN